MQSLLDIYTAYQRGDIDLEEAAIAFGMGTRALKISMTKQGVKFALMLSVLDKIAVNAISRDDAAAALNINVRSLNYLAERWKVRRPIAEDTLTRATSQVKWMVHKKFAIDFIAGRTNLEAAAGAAQIHPRQMRRVVARLLDKHLGMVYKDLGKLSLTQAQRVAKTIVEQEAITAEAMRIADEIAAGRRSRAEEALRLVVSRRMEAESR